MYMYCQGLLTRGSPSTIFSASLKLASYLASQAVGLFARIPFKQLLIAYPSFLHRTRVSRSAMAHTQRLMNYLTRGSSEPRADVDDTASLRHNSSTSSSVKAHCVNFLRYLFPAPTVKSNANLVHILVALLAVVYVLAISVTIAVIYELVRVHAENHMIAWAVSGIFVALSVPMPINDILMHALHYVRPELQRFYIRILWLVPIYSIQSWLALRFFPERVWFATARELYESFGAILWERVVLYHIS